MKIVYDPDFYNQLKKLDVRTRKSFKERILLFSKNPDDLQLNNHPLKQEYTGYRSINITSDCRAIYEESTISEIPVAYFVKIGTHKQLYAKELKP